MKRIKAACLEQTVQFLLKEDLPHEEAVKYAEAEYAHCLTGLEQSRTEHRILEKTERSDGSLMGKLKKQNNSYTASPAWINGIAPANGRGNCMKE